MPWTKNLFKKPGFVSGHDFSRAVNAAKSMRALAPEGKARWYRLLFQQLSKLAFTALVIAQLAAAQPAPSAPQARFVVVLDAAHGGDDTGARLADNQLEKYLTLALGARLRSLLSARGIQVVSTRDSDATVELNRRAEIANHAAAQACLSLHASESGSGVHLFVSSLAPVPPKRFPAWKTAQAAWVTRSLKLAGALNSALLQASINVTLGRTTLPAVDSMTCPAVAVEIAPERGANHEITSALDNKDYQARVAAALAAALVEWRTDAGRAEAHP
jgi:N-acetylmuramoyl-L-alanine amidase